MKSEVFEMEYNKRMKDLGDKICEARKAKNLSQQALIEILKDRADGSSVGRNTLSALENGKTSIRGKIKTLYAIGEVLDIDINYFIGEQEHKSLDRTDISQYTLLSDEAVNSLHDFSLQGIRSVSHFLNDLLLSPEIMSIAENYDRFCITKKAYDHRASSFPAAKAAFESETMEKVKNLANLLIDDMENGDLVSAEMVERQKNKLLNCKYTKHMHAAPLIQNVRAAEQAFLSEIQIFLQMVGEDGGKEES